MKGTVGQGRPSTILAQLCLGRWTSAAKLEAANGGTGPLRRSCRQVRSVDRARAFQNYDASLPFLQIVSQLFWLALYGSLSPRSHFSALGWPPERPSDGRSGECRSARSEEHTS